jgi:hypothetical protein
MTGSHALSAWPCSPEAFGAAHGRYLFRPSRGECMMAHRMVAHHTSQIRFLDNAGKQHHALTLPLLVPPAVVAAGSKNYAFTDVDGKRAYALQNITRLATRQLAKRIQLNA